MKQKSPLFESLDVQMLQLSVYASRRPYYLLVLRACSSVLTFSGQHNKESRHCTVTGTSFIVSANLRLLTPQKSITIQSNQSHLISS